MIEFLIFAIFLTRNFSFSANEHDAFWFEFFILDDRMENHICQLSRDVENTNIPDDMKQAIAEIRTSLLKAKKMVEDVFE